MKAQTALGLFVVFAVALSLFAISVDARVCVDDNDCDIGESCVDILDEVGTCESDGSDTPPGDTGTTSASCDSVTCTGGEQCVNGMCVDPYDFDVDEALTCSSDADCAHIPTDGSFDKWVCPPADGPDGWGEPRICIRDGVSIWQHHNGITAYGEKAVYKRCKCNTNNCGTDCGIDPNLNYEQCENDRCGRPEWENPSKDSWSDSDPLPALVGVDPLCVYRMNLTEAAGGGPYAVCSGGSCAERGGFLNQPPGRPGLSAANPLEVTPHFVDEDSEFATSLASMWIKKRGDPVEGSDGNYYWGLGNAMFYIDILTPTEVQKCDLVDGQDRPQIVPACAGTQDDCTYWFENHYHCGSCTKLNGWDPVSTESVCEERFRKIVSKEQYKTYACGEHQVDTVGEFIGCAESPGDFRDKEVGRALCKFGCAQGYCKCSNPPTLTSLTVTPEQVTMGEPLEITSVAKDPDKVYGWDDPPSQQQIKLRCGTTGGGLTGVSMQGTCDYEKPSVTLTWTAPDSITQNVILKRKSTGSFTETPPITLPLGERKWTDSDIEKGEAYVYRFKASTTDFADVKIEISEESCANSTAQEFAAVCTGGSTPSVELSWTIAPGAEQNVILKRKNNGSFVEYPKVVDEANAPFVTSAIDTDVELGTTYVYRYKPDTMTATDVSVEVSAINCADAPAGGSNPITGQVTFGIPITGMSSPGCQGSHFTGATGTCATHKSNNPGGWGKHAVCGVPDRVRMIIHHYECPGKSYPYTGPIFTDCAVTFDLTAFKGNQEIDVASDPVIEPCTGAEFHWGRKDCFVPRGNTREAGQVTCSATIAGVRGSKTFTVQGGSGGGGGPGDTGGGSSSGPCPKPTPFDANLCEGEWADENPSCTVTEFPAEWATEGGEKTIYCVVTDKYRPGLTSDPLEVKIMLDATGPISEIKSPDDGSAQSFAFPVEVSDVDDQELDVCYYYTKYEGGEKEVAERPCDSKIVVSVGPGMDCPMHGDCEVVVYATDASGNEGEHASRTYSIKLIKTNITEPLENTYRTKMFEVTVNDDDFLSYGVDCSYSVQSINGSDIITTVNDTLRECNGKFNVTIGPDGDCNIMQEDENTCRVVSRINATIEGVPAEDKDVKYYKVDWVTPFSEIIPKPTGWASRDFTLLVHDSPSIGGISQCQYRVVSNSTQTIPWKTRDCSGEEPSELVIGVGANAECRHEGGRACKIFVRPLDANGNPGYGDNVTVPIIFGVDDVNGFSIYESETTDIGLDFTGRLRSDIEMRAASFYACHADSNVDNCISSYNAERSGIKYSNLCGSFLMDGQGQCQLRCNDMVLPYYFVARGQTTTGSIDTITVISPVTEGYCPTFRIDEINELLEIFQNLEEGISIQISQMDIFIQQNGENDFVNNETLAAHREALMLTIDHLQFMEITMQDLSVPIAENLIDVSNDRLDEINDLLNNLVTPTSLKMSLTMPDIIRYNTSTVLPVTVTKTGPRDMYGTVYCSVTKPGGETLREKSACAPVDDPITFDLPFTTDRIGTWSYNCILGRAIRSDCSFEVNTSPRVGTFESMPGLGSYIESISAPSTATKRELIVVNAMVNNPDEVEKFVKVRCDFIDPQGFFDRNYSECTNIPANDVGVATVYRTADRIGNWTINRCRVEASEFAGCHSLVLNNVSLEEKNVTVILPTDLYIEAVYVPGSPVMNDTKVSLSAVVQNPSSQAAFATFECNFRNPQETYTLSGQQGIELGSNTQFQLNITADIVGNWYVDNCTISKSSNPDYSASVPTYTTNNPGSFEVIKGTNLTITSVSLPPPVDNGTLAGIDVSVRNPSVARYAQVSCVVRNPLNFPTTETSLCSEVGTDETVSLPVSVLIDQYGVWNVDSCSVYGSLSADCASRVLHGTVYTPGNLETSSPYDTSSVANLYINSVNTPSSAYKGSKTNILLDVVNTNHTHVAYALAGCTSENPVSGTERLVSECTQIPASTSQFVALPQSLDVAGEWTIDECFVNSSTKTDCSPSVTTNTSEEVRTFDVVDPTDLFVSEVEAPDTIVNNSDAGINVQVTNPLTDDKFGSVLCTITNPKGINQTASMPCTVVLKQSTKTYNFSVFADTAGTWVVSKCSVQSSSSLGCAGAVATGELYNGDTFSVIRGYNLQFSTINVNEPVYLDGRIKVDYTVYNPSTTDRFSRVSCTASKGGITKSNSSVCTSITRESFTTGSLSMQADSLGQWNLLCNLERSFDDSCSTPTADDSLARTISVTNPPDLFIESVDVPSIADKDKPVGIIVNVKNIGVVERYGYVGCTFENFRNETFQNSSICTDFTRDISTPVVQFTPEFRGNWDVYDCFVRVADTMSQCENNTATLHNKSTEKHSFNVQSPALMIVDAKIANDNLFVGDLLDIEVDVKNDDVEDVLAFVNCTVFDPANNKYEVSSPESMISMGVTDTYHVQKLVDVTGTWRVTTCSVYSIHSPPTLEDQITLGEIIDVYATPPADYCSATIPCPTGQKCENNKCVSLQTCSLSNCPGVKNACYCQGNSCIACGAGFTCISAKCVPETPNTQVCRTVSDCAAGLSCIGGICVEPPAECAQDSDCPVDLACENGTCKVPSEGISQDLLNLVAIALGVIAVPAILFVYIRRVM